MLRIIPDKLKEIIIINDQIIQAANEDDLTSLETMLRIIPDKLKEIIIINDQIIQAANEDILW